MKFAFIEPKRMTSANKLIIEHANKIIGEMQAQGYVLTVRQLYYRFVTLGLLENKQANYTRLAGILDEGRKQGLIDWAAFEDRTRSLHGSAEGFDSPGEFMNAVRDSYSRNIWEDQDVYCEVWVEKDALLGVIERPCIENRVGYFACRGYASSSALYEAGNRLRRKYRQAKQVVIFHLGDHDPSGIDMTRNNEQMLRMYAQTDRIEVRRLALHMEQVEEYALPPNPAKETDSRFAEYAKLYGDESWELDALDPAVLDQIVTDAIDSVIDRGMFDEALAREESERDDIALIADNFDDVISRLRDEL